MCRAALTLLGAALVAGCGEDGRAAIELEVDYLTPATRFGADLLVTGTIRGCTGVVPAAAYADGVEVARQEGTLIYLLDLSAVGEAPRHVFQMSIPGAALDPARHGLPVAFDLVLEVECQGARVRSPPYPVVFVPTASSFVPAWNPRRFWAADTPGDLLVCEGTRLTRYAGGVTAGASVDLGFVCATAELRGDPTDDRRYLVADQLGIAAIGPEPTLLWTRSLRLGAAWVESAMDHPVVIEDGAEDQLLVLDRDSGAPRVEPITLPRPTRGDPVRDAAGDLLIMEAERPADSSTLTYYVRRFDAAGALRGAAEVVHYGWNAPSLLATFAPDGAYLYVAAAPDEATRFVQKIDLASCGASCAVSWATEPAQRWRSPVAEIFGRLLISSDDDLGWLDTSTGALLGRRFATGSGNRFVRATVEADGSLLAIADGLGDVAQGLYVFDPGGADVLRLSGSDLILRWLVSGWGDGALVSYRDEVHLLYSRSRYSEMLVP